MGSNRPPSEEAVNEAVTRPRPISLTKAELENHDVVAAKEPIEVTAWVRFPETPIRVKGTAVAWTDTAVQVEWTSFSGAKHTAWVWASAVKRRG